VDEMTYTVTLTAKELTFRERARKAGIPAIVVSMYAGALQRLVDKERPWVGLTDEDRQELAAEQHSWEGLCFAVEAKLKEQNGGDF